MFQVNYMDLINNELNLQYFINELLELEIDWDRIYWVRCITNVDKAEEIFNIYLKELYNTSLEEINSLLKYYKVEKTNFGFTKEIELE